MSGPRHNHPRDSQCLITHCPRAGWAAGKQEARHAALTEAIEAVEGVPVHSVWNYKDPALDVLDRSAVIDALTRLREGS